MSKKTSTGNVLTPVRKGELDAAAQNKEQERARAAWIMRQNGSSYFEIAEALGMSESMASQKVSEVARHMAVLVDAGAKQEILTMELARLDRLQTGIFNQAESGDLRAIEGVLKIMAHRAKLLGLDQVTVDNRKQTVVITGEDTSSYLEAVRQAMGD
jgi:hypothetical protein